MIGYVTIGTRDMEKAKSFYGELLEPLGARMVIDMGRIALFGSGAGQPMLGVCIPYDEEAPHPGNGNMIAFTAGSEENVDKLHARALELGATDEGAPGKRGETFYGGYFRDPDGNKAVFFHAG